MTGSIKMKKYSLETEMAQRYYGFGIRHVQVACMCLCMMTLFIGRSCMSVAVLAMTDTSRANDTNIKIYDWDKKTQGLILSSFFGGYMLMQIPCGILAKRYGGKPILLVALLVNAILCLILPMIASVGGWLMVCAARFGMGLTQACLFPSTHTLLGKWLPVHERTALAGIVYGGVQLGTIISMPVSGVLAETALGWQLIYYAISGLMMVVAAIWYWFSASSPEEHSMISYDEKMYILKGLPCSSAPPSLRTPWKHIFKSKGMWAVAVTHIATGVSFMFFFVDLPTYLEKGLNISLKGSAALSALPFAGMWIGGLLSTTISEKVFNKGLLSVLCCRRIFNSVALFGSAAGLIALSFIGVEHSSLAIIILVFGLTMHGCSNAGYMMNILDLSPNFAGVLLGMTNCLSNIVTLFTPIITSFILRNDPTDTSRWKIVFLLIAAVCVICNFLYLTLSTTERQEWDDPEFLEKDEIDPEEMKPVLKKHFESLKSDKN